ncbi:MAG: DUF4845 domain-containing protein [Gammaproteobacteria bacterium]|nr:DUF4845 domain-containing protein [Gammaproteobacteria bacterium]
MEIKSRKRQQGVTMISVAFFLGLLAFAVFTVLKLFPVYMESFTVASSVKNLENRTEEYMGAKAVRDALMKNFGVNNVTAVSAEDISVTREDQMYLVDVNYEVRIPYIKNLSLVVTFENHAEVPAR